MRKQPVIARGQAESLVRVSVIDWLVHDCAYGKQVSHSPLQLMAEIFDSPYVQLMRSGHAAQMLALQVLTETRAHTRTHADALPSWFCGQVVCFRFSLSHPHAHT